MSITIKLKQWFYKLLIYSKQIKQVSFTAAELNEMLATNLPETFALDVPGCKGELIVEEAELTLPKHENKLNVSLFCAMKIETLGNPIYRAHLLVNLSGIPCYHEESCMVRMHSPEVLGVHLVKDEYSLLTDTKTLITQLTPSPLKNLVSNTFKSTLNLLSAGAYSEVSNYLSLYLTGSKQKIIDFHRPEVETIVKELVESGDLEYEMDQDILEEQLFAELGRDVKVEDGLLYFVFHPN